MVEAAAEGVGRRIIRLDCPNLIMANGPTPIIVALSRFEFIPTPEMQSPVERAVALLDKLASEDKPRRVFIELAPDVLERMRSGDIPNELLDDPFIDVVHFADAKGWQVIPLDRAMIRQATDTMTEPLLRKLLSHTEPIKASDGVMQRYLSWNVKERSWALKLRRERPTEDDLVLLTPHHVNGLVEMMDYDSGRVVWIDRVHEKPPGFGRLDPAELAQLHQQRRDLRQKPKTKQ